MAKRNYDNNYGSVTQILGILRKQGLENWFKYNTATFCNEKSKRGREIGTQIHEAIQSHIEKDGVKIETQYGEEVSNALKSFMLFKKENKKIKLKKAEIQLTSNKYKFNGTLDCIGDDDDEVIVSWKTGECKEKTEPPIYDEYLYQESAYVFAYNEQEKRNVKKTYIVCFAKDKIAYNLRLLEGQELKDCFEKVFLQCLSIYNYQKKGASNGYSTRQRNSSDSERIERLGKPSTKLPSNF